MMMWRVKRISSLNHEEVAVVALAPRAAGCSRGGHYIVVV